MLQDMVNELKDCILPLLKGYCKMFSKSLWKKCNNKIMIARNKCTFHISGAEVTRQNSQGQNSPDKIAQ